MTALYELTLQGDRGLIDPLRYAKAAQTPSGKGGELAFLRLRYKNPDTQESRLIEQAIRARDIQSDATTSSERFRFVASVAAFAQLLKGETYTGAFGFTDVQTLARAALGADEQGYRHEFIKLVQTADSLSSSKAVIKSTSKEH